MIRTMIRTLAAPLLVLVCLAHSRPCPHATADTVALVGGTIHTVTGPTIEKGALVFTDGRIVSLGTDAEIPADAVRHDISGQHVYPSLIAPYTHLGLIEISAVRATRDLQETGDFNPNAIAHKAANPDSELIPVARSNGVLLALTAPRGGLFSGQSSLMKLHGWTWEEMLVTPAVAMHVNWPRTSDSDEGEGEEEEENASPSRVPRQTPLERLVEIIEDARAYQAARQADPATPFDIRWEAMQRLVRGKQPMIVRADRLEDIESAVAFAARHALRLILLGGHDAPHAARLLKAHDVPVMVSAVLRLPLRRDENQDAAYAVPGKLYSAGVQYCIAGESRNASNVRNLPYHAATAAAYGLPREEALKSITIHPARILGVDDRVGSLETGKEATLIVATGDPLETTTRVVRAFAGGVEVDLQDRHKQLYRKFRQRIR